MEEAYPDAIKRILQSEKIREGDGSTSEMLGVMSTVAETEALIQEAQRIHKQIKANLLRVASIMGLGEELTGRL